MTKKFRMAIIGLFILQMLMTVGYELAHDEAYYWLFSKNLAWGYFDHPPITPLIIRIFSFLPHSELAVRIGFLLLQYLSLEVIWKLVPENRKTIASLMFFAFPLASFSGLFALPDMPLLFMTTLYLYCLQSFLQKDKGSVWKLGFVIPILLYSKYHGILLVFFTLLAIPKLLLRKDFWIVTLLSILLFIPHVWWQYQHDFATLRYHFLERPKSEFSIKRSLEYLFLQVGLAGIFIGPVVWWSVLKYRSLSDFDKALKWICIGVSCFFLFSTFSKKFEANWTIFLAAPLIILSLKAYDWNNKWVQRLLVVSASLAISARILLILPVFGIKRLDEFHGWKDWSEKMQSMCSGGKLLANNYQIASKLSFYLNQKIHALNYRSRKNQFDYWPYSEEYKTSRVCYLTDKQEFDGLEIISPDGKRLKFVTVLTFEKLQDLKSISVANE